MPESRNGRVITFYSYKGGTGRSMALANLAFALAQRNGGKRVLAVDWDLEAPGLHRYFQRYLRPPIVDGREPDVESLPGLIEILSRLRESIAGAEIGLERDHLSPIIARAEWDSHILATDRPSLDFLKAGRFDATYQERINTFDWEALYKVQPSLFGAVADYLAQRYDYVLVDSRTGLTDISGVCTALLPDTIVAVFTPNSQSISGVLTVLSQAAEHRRQSDDLRSLQIFPLASRIEVNEKRLQEAWRFGDPEEGIKGYEAEFQDLFKELYGLENCDLKAYFNDAQIQYVPFYSFGEEIAVRSEEESNLSLARSYTTFGDILSAPQNPWEYISAREPVLVPSEEIPWDLLWFTSQKTRALAGFGLDRAYMEVRFSLPYVRISKPRPELLEAVRSAQVSGSGWQLAEVRSDSESKPRAAADGIVAEVRTSGSYCYWALRSNGDFFLLRSLFEDTLNTKGIHFDVRIAEVAETFLYCRRLYERLGVPPRSQVRTVIEHSGLRGRVLESMGSGSAFPYHGRRSDVDQSITSLKMTLEAIDGSLTGMVKAVTSEIFELFEFTTLQDSAYANHVDKVRSGR